MSTQEEPPGPPDAAGSEELMRSWLNLTRAAMRAEGVEERAVDRVVHRMVFGCSVEEADRSKTMQVSGE